MGVSGVVVLVELEMGGLVDLGVVGSGWQIRPSCLLVGGVLEIWAS